MKQWNSTWIHRVKREDWAPTTKDIMEDQPAFTYSKSTIEKSDQCAWNLFKVNNKQGNNVNDVVSIGNFKQVNTSWESYILKIRNNFPTYLTYKLHKE